MSPHHLTLTLSRKEREPISRPFPPGEGWFCFPRPLGEGQGEGEAQTGNRGLNMDLDFSGKWHNQHGSEMTLTITADGKVTGRFQTGVDSPSSSEEFPLVGFVCGDLIAFSVNFGKYQSVTAWTGQHTIEDGVEAIESMWHLAVNIEDRAENAWLWSGIRSGADTFRRGPHSTGARRSKLAPSHPLGRLE